MSEVTKLNTAVDRSLVNKIEQIMLTMPQVELHVEHKFAHGVYSRELHIPAGITLTGAIHKFENLNFLLKGCMSIVMEDGQVKELHAPCSIVSPAGVKRLATTHTDCIWVTIFGTPEKNPEKIVAEFTTTSEEEFLEFSKILQVEGA